MAFPSDLLIGALGSRGMSGLLERLYAQAATPDVPSNLSPVVPQEAPQIYDIAPVPYFPGDPGIVEWGIFLLLSALALYAAWKRSMPNRSGRVSPAIAQAIERDIEAALLALAAERLDPRLVKEVIGALSISTRRAVSPQERLEAYSPHQLDQRIAELEASGQPPAYAQLIQLLARVEYYKYVPDPSLLQDRDVLAKALVSFAAEARRYFSLSPAPSPADTKGGG